MNAAGPKRVKRRWRPWKVLVGVLLSLLVGFFGWFWYRSWRIEARLQEAIALADRNEPIWRMDDLVREYEQLPFSPDYRQVVTSMGAYRGWFGDDIRIRPGSIPYELDGEDFNIRFPAPYFKILDERLKDPLLTPVRDKLQQFMSAPHPGRFEYRDLTQIQLIRAVCNYLRDEMEFVAHQGNTERLPFLFEVSLRLTNFPLIAPKTIDQLVGIACRNFMLSSIKRILALRSVHPETLATLQKLLSESDMLDVSRILRTNRAEHLAKLDQAMRDKAAMTRLKNEYMSVQLSIEPTLKERMKYYKQWLDVELAIIDMNLAKAEILESHHTALILSRSHPQQVVVYLEEQSQSFNLISRRCCKYAVNRVQANFNMMADQRALMAALACERFRLRKGKWPEKLDDLLPEFLASIPTDPFTGKPLLYRHLADGVAIYSVSKNWIDDGGHVLYLQDNYPLDRGIKLFNPELRGRKFEEVYPDRVRKE